jgi:hypothetical protein
MVYGMTLITHASSVFPLFSFVARFFIHQSAAGMASSSRVLLSSDKVDKVLEEILSDSESSSLIQTMILVGSMIYQLVRLLP